MALSSKLSFRLLFLLITVAILAGGGITYFFYTPPYLPLHLLDSNYPSFSDDLDLQSLRQAAEKQLAYLEKQPEDTLIHFDTASFPTSWVAKSIQDFLIDIRRVQNLTQLSEILQKDYHIYQAGGRKGKRNKEMLVTGYYEPLFDGSLVKTPPYIYPLYKVPDSLLVKGGNEGKKQIGRIDESGEFVNFWSRQQIETQNLLSDSELVFLKDPFDNYLLHVQGSGRIKLADGTVKSVRFAGSNGLAYNSIGKLLVDQGVMDIEEVSVPSIRSYLVEHPERLNEILHHNPRYIFFTWGDKEGPVGSLGEVLTPGRSIAVDPSALPTGTLAYLACRRPVIDSDDNILRWEEFGRFVFPQDSGSAIKGTGRVDIFWGNGKYAEIAASHMAEPGKLFFLLKKGYDQPQNNQ